MSIVGGDQSETMDVQFGRRGWGFIAMLPRGAHAVKATPTHPPLPSVPALARLPRNRRRAGGPT
ncbi:hypothetical protein FB459_2902 [Yimella lutea]|uniref:Uncharacterized protein n=1 Tax=Yimella lutea TaxID=587872 RepID=A0A542EJH1_9MICO|nr:hypothetical protein [Yimella lutea]TQJ15356.1 hypothetical protein FB459_2902 [Yimella lutea]